MRKAAFLFLITLFAASTGITSARSSIDDALARLKQIGGPTSISEWKYLPSEAEGAEQPSFDDSTWKVGTPEFEWGSERTAWLRKTVTIPETIGGVKVAGSKVTFCAGVDDDGECYVNGVHKLRFHWGECRVVLTENARPGEQFSIAIKGINQQGPGRLLFAHLEISTVEEMRSNAAAFVYDIEMSRRVIDAEQDAAKRAAYQKALANSVSALDMAALDRGDTKAFITSFADARKALDPLSRAMKEYTVDLIGHAHIDMNWLWLWPETVDVCKNTFSTMINIMNDHPDFRFSQSQASCYIAMEELFPDLFAEMQRRVRSGQWEITGSTWTEGDMNMASGESIVRQILYARQYFLRKFGVWTETCWEPDTFGHAWTIPQILAKSGLKYYYFMRCPKDERIFWWQAPDGSRVLAYNRGTYNGKVDDSAMDAAFEMNQRYGTKRGAIIYGVGDHGGGPTREDIAKALELQKRVVYPQVNFSTSKEFYEGLLKEKKDWPVINTELNTIFEGCYTTHGDIKKMNRVMENLLPTAEAFSALAIPYGYRYPTDSFLTAWRNTCFNQFHDILDGSAIHGSYDYSKKLFDKAYDLGDSALTNAMLRLARNIDTSGSGVPVIVFNPLSWERTEVVRVLAPPDLKDKTVQVCDSRGRAVPSRVDGDQIVFLAKGVPSLGYHVFRLKPEVRNPQSAIDQQAVFATSSQLENQFYRVRIDPASGALTSIYDKSAQREVLVPGQKGNLLQLLFEDPHGMSAWNIGPVRKTLDLDSGATVEVVSQGGPAATVRIRHTYNKSTFVQDVTLYDSVPRIDFKLSADWYEQGTGSESGPMLKVAFPINVPDGKATFEIPFGSIERPANGNEVPAQKWIDVSGADYGVSLLNDCKYGHDVNGATMRLTLLRCSYEPDPMPDQGHHEITYSLYPHQGDWTKADSVRRGYELNNPLIPMTAENHQGRLPARHSFLRVEPSNVIVTALKKAEESDDLILRFYECEGRGGTASIHLGFAAKSFRETNLMEQPMKGLDTPIRNGRISVPIGKWEIKTLRISD